MEEIIKALTDDRIKLIGICGLAGVGKTKMVQEVRKRAKEEKLFDEVAFVAVGQNPDITKVQNSIADIFGLNDLKTFHDATTRASLLRRILSQDNKKILLILDDIWVEFNLEDRGIPLGGSHETFKIIYTSRFRDIWHDVPDKKEIPLELLSEDEAWQLFREKAGDSADARALQPIAKQIVNECGRLPLALVLIGTVLSENTTTDIWEEMLDRLTRAGNTPANEELSSRLALSYEYLKDKQAKRLFLLCCLFQKGEDIDIEDLARYGLGLSLFDGINEMEEVRRRVLVLVNLLKSNYLLLDGKDDKFVKVHDVVRYVGISIAAKDIGALVIHGEVSEWPQKDTYKDYTFISLISMKITELPKRLTCPNLEFLLLDCMKLKVLPCDFFEGMEKLKVLVLKNFRGILALPPSLRNLHTLSLSNFNDRLANVGGLFNLKTLSFRNSLMMVLPKEIGELVNLRLLDWTGIDVIGIPPNVISRLVDLEELYVGGEFWNWEGEGKKGEGRNANLRELESLSKLNTLEICIRSDVLIPKVRIFSKLKIYKVTIVQVVDEGMDDDDEEMYDDEMDDDDEEMDDDDEETDDDDDNEEMDDDDDDEEMDDNDEEMDDDIWDGELEDERDNLFRKCKRVFRVKSSLRIPLNRGGIDVLLTNSDCLVLEGKGCNKLVQALLLRDGVDGLQPLKLLRIRSCDTPECLIDTMNPVHLRIADAPIFPILKVLDLRGLVNLEEIWRICGGPVPARSFGELTFIRIQNCGRLRNLFQLPIVGCLPQLKRLIISSCRMMEEVFWKDQQDDVHAATNRIEFPKLEILRLEKLPRLVGFCRGIDQIDFPQLKELYLVDIPRVNFLFHNNGNLSSNSKRNGNVSFLPLFPEKVSLPNLEALDINKLENLERLEHRPFSAGSFSKLKQFWVRDCGKLLCVIPSQFLRMLRELQDLIVESCNSLEVVFELEGLESNEPNPEILSTLKFVKLRNLPKLSCISKRYPVDIKYIQTLEIHNCNSLRYVFAPTRTKSIPQLRDLKVSSCEMLARIVAEENGLDESSVDEVEFPQLERLELLDLPNLMSFFPNVNTASLAKSNDHLYNPMQPQPLFNEKVAIPSLEHMKLIGLQNMSDLWGSELPISSFSKLKNLQVIGCTSLGNIPCILWSGDLHNTTQDLQEVARLLYVETNGVLALRSNGTMTMWQWIYSMQNPSREVAANSTLPFNEDAMTNDVTGVNLDEAVPCMAISKEYYSKYIISACGGKVSLYDMQNFLAKRTFMPPPPASTFFAFYPRDENIIAIGMEDSTIRMYNHREDEVKTELKGHEKRITGLAFSTYLNILVSSAADAQLRIWKIDTWEHLKSVSIQLPPDKACNGDTRVQFHSDQIRLLVSHETQLAIYDSSEMDCFRQWVPQDVLSAPISFAVYSCDSQLVYTSFCDGNIGVFDADSLTLACRIVTSIYLYPAMLNGGQAVYPKVIVAHPKKPNQFAIGLTNGFVVIMKPQESEGKWGLSPNTVDNGMLNDRIVSSSNTSNHTRDQNGDGAMARSMEKPKTLDDVTDKSKPWKVAETQCQLVVMPDSTDEAHKVAHLLYKNSCEVLALGCNGALRLWRKYSSINNQSGMATASVFPLQWQPASGLAMTNDVTGVNLEEAVPCMALSKNYSKMISACGGKVSLFNIETFGVMKKFIAPSSASTFLAFHPQDDNIIAIGMEDSTIRIYSRYNPWEDWEDRVGSELKGHEKRITGLAFSSNLKILVSSGADAQLCIWRMDTWKHLKSVPIQLPAGKASNGNTRVQFHSDQIRLLVSHETLIAIYDASKMDYIRQWVPQDVLPARISFAAYSCNSQLVYTSFCDGNIGVFDADRLMPTHRIAPSVYSPTLSSGSHAVYPLVVATHLRKPNKFAIGLTNGSVIIMEPKESEGKWGLSSNTSNHAPDQGIQLGGGDTVMGEHRTVEEEHRTVEELPEGGSMGLAASVPATPASTPFTPTGSVIEMEIGGLDVSVERRAMEERGTPASATPLEFPFTPSDIPIETEGRGGEDEDAEAAARRLASGKSVVGESDGQEARDPLAAPLFRPPIGSSREQGVSLRDTLECADPRDLSARLAEAPSLASVLAREEDLQEAEREEEERQRAREGPRVTLVQEVEAAARERAAFSEASYVPRVHFFIPFGVDAFVPRQVLQEEQVLHDPGSHMGMSGPLEDTSIACYGGPARSFDYYEALDPRVRNLVDTAGFGPFIQTLFTGGRSDRFLVRALVERWWNTTNTFHLPFGEMTITPLDFAAITGLRVGGDPIPFDSELYRDQRALEFYLGPGFRAADAMVKYSQFEKGYWDRTPVDDKEVAQMARAYLLYVFGVSLFPNRRNGVHLGWLPALHHLEQAGRFDFGGAALATLYYFLGSASRQVGTTLGGYWRVLEIWAFEVLGMYEPENTHRNPRVLPRALRWAPKHRKSSEFRGNLREFRLFLDRMSGEGVLWNLWTGLQADFLVRSREVTRSRVLLESPFGWQWYLGERVTRQSLGLTEFRVPAGVPLFMLRTGDYTREEIERHTRPVEDLTAYLSPSLDYAGYRERYLAYHLRMEERLSGALGGNESEAVTGASGSRGSRRGGASSRRRSGGGRGTRRVAEVGHTFPKVSRVVSVVTREGIEGEIAIPSRSASITLPEAEVPRAWVENVYRLLLDCFTVIRQGAMGVSPEILPCGATAAAHRGGARRRSSSGGPTGREGGREESSSRGGGRGEATSRGRGVWVTRQPRGGAIHRPRTKNARNSPPPIQSTSTPGRVLRERRAQPAEVVERGGDDEEEEEEEGNTLSSSSVSDPNFRRPPGERSDDDDDGSDGTSFEIRERPQKMARR